MSDILTNNVDLDEKYLDKIKDIDFSPVFILGFHRSGTSILYKMISSTDEFNSLNTYHVINYDTLLYNKTKGREKKIKDKLNEIFSKKDRGIDRLKMNTDLPLEYAFLINDNYILSKLTEKNLHKFLEICRKIQYIEGKNKKLLLKNPWDLGNFLFIKKHLPNAKFVFIHRHPLSVINSSIKALKVLTHEKTVYSDMISSTAEKIAKNPLISGLIKLTGVLRFNA